MPTGAAGGRRGRRGTSGAATAPTGLHRPSWAAWAVGGLALTPLRQDIVSLYDLFTRHDTDESRALGQAEITPLLLEFGALPKDSDAFQVGAAAYWMLGGQRALATASGRRRRGEVCIGRRCILDRRAMA